MQKSVTVPGISCGHCTATIQRELAELPGVQAVKADIDSKNVDIQWDAPATWESIEATLQEIGYPAASEA